MSFPGWCKRVVLTWLNLCIENFIALCPIISPYLKPWTGLWWNRSNRIRVTIPATFFYSFFIKCSHAFHRLKNFLIDDPLNRNSSELCNTWAIFWSFALSWFTAENNVCEMPIVFRQAVFDFVRIDKFLTFRPFLCQSFRKFRVWVRTVWPSLWYRARFKLFPDSYLFTLDKSRCWITLWHQTLQHIGTFCLRISNTSSELSAKVGDFKVVLSLVELWNIWRNPLFGTVRWLNQLNQPNLKSAQPPIQLPTDVTHTNISSIRF